jgi:hypothetical protein
MKRILTFTAAALLGLANSAWAGGLFCGWCPSTQCMVPPPPSCPDCSCPCEHRLSLCVADKSCKYIEGLHACDCCTRIKAARKLGNRLCADFCKNPEVLSALVQALQMDSCWEVREAAAWSIMLQNARVEEGILALYIASKLDPHYLVRYKANEALDILLLCRRACYKDQFASADDLIKKLRGKYKPGSPEWCGVQLGGCGLVAAPALAPAPAAPEPLPAPAPAKKLTDAAPLPQAPAAPAGEPAQLPQQ